MQLFTQYCWQNHGCYCVEHRRKRDSVDVGRVATRLVGFPVNDLLRFRIGDVGDVPLVARVVVAETDLKN